MPNNNCLEGFRCPECGHEDSFNIEVTTTVRMTDDGSDYSTGDLEWEDWSHCACGGCRHHGTVSEFRGGKKAIHPAKAVLTQLVSAIEATGGLDAQGNLVADEDWLDLADVYAYACAVLGKKVMQGSGDDT